MKPMLFPQGQLRRSGVSKTGMEPLGSFFGLFLPGLMCYQGAQPAWIIVSKQQNGGQVWAYWTGWSWAVLGQTTGQEREALSTGLNTGWPHAAKMTILGTGAIPKAQEVGKGGGRGHEPLPCTSRLQGASIGQPTGSRTSLVGMDGSLEGVRD